MPKLPVPRLNSRAALAFLAVIAGGGAAAALPAAAGANPKQLSIIQDGSDLSNPAVLYQFRQLGANTIRVIVPWAAVAPNGEGKRPNGFNATDPNAYPKSHWAPYDNIVRAAAANGLRVDFTISGGAPLWAEGKGVPHQGKNFGFAWKPDPAAFGQFAQALGLRYDGSFTPEGDVAPLPAVNFWAIYNEPNFGQDLGPQTINGSRTLVAPMMFRNLLSAGWKALQQHHKHQTIIWGEFAARGNNFVLPRRGAPQGLPGDYGQTKPLIFIRTLFCLGSNYRELRGGAARSVGCPTTAAASRRFRANNPALFSASGVSDHPYPDNLSPVRDGLTDPNFAAFGALGKFGRELDRVTGTYGAHPHYGIYNTEYGYITHPPARRHYVSPNTAAYYINWAEYLSYKNRRIKSYMQYLLFDPPPTAGPYGGFSSGLKTYRGRPKAPFYAYRMPLYMPHTRLSHKRSAEVWGAARPAPFALGAQSARLELKPAHSGWRTITTFKVNRAGGYFDLHVKFPKSGLVRVQWSYPKSGGLVSGGLAGFTASSRTFAIKVQ